MSTTLNGRSALAVRPPGILSVSVRATTTRTGHCRVLLQWLARQIHHGGIEKVSTLYGWRSPAVNRQHRGHPRSNHLSGTAFDYNGAKHPYEPKVAAGAWRSGWSQEQERQIRVLLATLEGTVEWGLDFRVGLRDAMHFEIAPGVKDAQLAAVRRKLRGGEVRVTVPVLNGRARPTTTSEIVARATDGNRIAYNRVVFREGRIWLRSREGPYFAAEFTTFVGT